MYIPTGAAAYVLAVVNMCGWGLWGNVLKGAPGQMRIQSFYWLYILGIFIVSLIVAFSAGSAQPDETLLGQWQFYRDDFKASASNMMIAWSAGLVFNVANFGLTICINLIGLALSFGIIIGMGFVTGTIFAKYIVPWYTVDNSNVGLMWGGIVLGGIATVGFAIMNYIKEQDSLPEDKRSMHSNSAALEHQIEPVKNEVEKKKNIFLYGLCFCSGLAMSFWGCIMGFANFDADHNPKGLSPFGTSFWFNMGCVCSTIVMLPLSLSFDLDGHGPTTLTNWLNEMRHTPWRDRKSVV